MERMDRLMTALHKTRTLQEKYPDLVVLKSILNQLEYLTKVASGQNQDRSKLANIILGVQAAREIEPIDMDLAEVLYAIADDVEVMRT